MSPIVVVRVDSEGNLDGDAKDAEVYFSWFYLKPTTLHRVLESALQLPQLFTEPLPPESPLWSLPNVFITPHCSDNSPRVKERSLALFLDNFTRYRQGKPLRNVVDQTVGY